MDGFSELCMPDEETSERNGKKKGITCKRKIQIQGEERSETVSFIEESRSTLT
jgi:hypothetical protein